MGFLSIITLCLIEKRIDWLRNLHVFKGLLLFSVLSLAWIFMVNEAENSNYVLQMIHRDLLPKLKGGHESHGKPPLFHLAILPLTFWPASLFLWQAGVYAFKHCHEKLIKFILAWIIPTWVFFELMPTKLPQYLLPIFPAIALLCALAIQENKGTRPGRWIHILQVLWIVLSVGFALSMISFPYLVMQQFTLASVILCVGIITLSIVAVSYAWSGGYKRACATLLFMAIISYSLIFTSLLPQLKPLWLTTNVTQLIDKKDISNDRPLLVVGYDEPSLVFSLNTRLVQFVSGMLAKQILQADPSRIALVDSTVFANWGSRNGFSVLARTKGFHYSKGRWAEFELVGQQKSGGTNDAL